MLSSCQKLGILVLSSFLLILVAEAYNDVDLRIAERKAIPHYIRHSVEYPDIDIKKIMQQRGIQIKPYQPSNINRGAHHHQGSNADNNSNVWGSHHHQGSNAVDNSNVWGSHHHQGSNAVDNSNMWGSHHNQGSNAVGNSKQWEPHHHQGSNAVDNSHRWWGSRHGKTNAMSNHLEPRPSRYFWKKSQRESKYFKNPHHASKAKVKSRYGMYHK